MSLPERPGLLHAIPVCDLFVILWLLFLLGSALTRSSGVAVELPPSRFQLERYDETHVITLAPGEGASRMHFGRDVVTMEQLIERLERLAAEGAQARAMILLKTDGGTPVVLERKVSEVVLGMGFRLALVGSTPAEAVAPEAVDPAVGGESNTGGE